MTFEKHLFISYAHIDNQPTPDDPEGWVARFHKYLKSYLSTNIGAEAKIWRDDRLRGNDLFWKEIVKQFPDTACLVSILSPRYVESEGCLLEVQEFGRAAAATGGMSVDDKTRIIGVRLLPIPDEKRSKLPAPLGDTLGYEFYQETEGNRYLPLDPAFGNGETYRRRMYFLAEDIAELIRRLEHNGGAGAAVSNAPDDAEAARPCVYLAESSWDRAEDREKIRADLRAHGYRVLPPEGFALPDIEPEYITHVRELLARADLSVHLVGASPGKMPDGLGRKSVVELQNILAAAESQSRGLPRLIWLPAGTDSPDPQHKAFITALQGDCEPQRGADLITGELEDLKSAIWSSLKKAEARKAMPQPAEAGQPLVYIVCVEEDIEAVVDVMDQLVAEGFRVELPVFTGDSASLRAANEELAASCDGLLLYFGSGTGTWKLHKQAELTRLLAMRRGKNPPVQFTCIAAPLTADKRIAVLKRERNMITVVDGCSPAALAAFTSAVREQRDGNPS